MAESVSEALTNRFAGWPRLPARLALAVLAALLVLSAIANVASGEGPHSVPSLDSKAQAARPDRDEDLALYDHVIARMEKGEGYYDVIAEEHRASHYPLRPGLAVRLPTLAVILAHVPQPGQVLASVLMLVAVMAAWWRRLGEEPDGQTYRLFAMTLLFFGMQVSTTRYFFVLHELWVGSLLALAMGLYRPDKGRWIGAFIAAAVALSIREHALPFVLLMGAFAAWHRRWKEAAAWGALAAVFLGALAWHLHIVAGLVRPDDPAGASWVTLRGISGWLSMIMLASNLRWLPTMIGAPLVVLMTFGWASRRNGIASFATLLFLGYGLLFMIAGRPDNWYWGFVIQPVMWIGLAYAPAGVRALWQAAFPSGQAATTDAPA